MGGITRALTYTKIICYNITRLKEAAMIRFRLNAIGETFKAIRCALNSRKKQLSIANFNGLVLDMATVEVRDLDDVRSAEIDVVIMDGENAISYMRAGPYEDIVIVVPDKMNLKVEFFEGHVIRCMHPDLRKEQASRQVSIIEARKLNELVLRIRKTLKEKNF
jgi:hypothetical protein